MAQIDYNLDYLGLDANEWTYLTQTVNDPTLNAFLNQYFENVSGVGGSPVYLFKGDTQDFIDALIDAGLDEDCVTLDYYTYNKSTWGMTGF